MRIRVVFVVAVVALALLTVACGGGNGQSTATATPTVGLTDRAELTAEQAIQRVVDMLARAPDQQPDPSTAIARRMTECEARELMRWQGVPWSASPDPSSESPVWLVEVRGEFSGFIGYGLTPDPSPPLAGKWIEIVHLNGSPGAAAGLSDERTQEGPELSNESILERALDEVAPPGSENEPDPSTATLARTTYREAIHSLRAEGAPKDFSERPHQGDPVWLFEVKGEFVNFCPGPKQSGRYFLVLALDGFVESGGFIPDSTPAVAPMPTVPASCLRDGELSREQAVDCGRDLVAAAPQTEIDPSTAAASLTTYGEALESMQR